MRFIQSQTSFRSGQLSRKLDGRIDIDEYKNGCVELSNMIPLKTGGAKRLPGDRFITEILQDFSFLKEEIYIFSDGKERLFRFYSTSVSAPYVIQLDIFNQDGAGNFASPLITSIATGISFTDNESELSLAQYEDTVWVATSEGTHYLRGWAFNGTTFVLNDTFSNTDNFYNWPLRLENNIQVTLTGARNNPGGDRDAVISNKIGGIEAWATYLAAVGEIVCLVGVTRSNVGDPFRLATQYYRIKSFLGTGAVLTPFFDDPANPGFDLLENNTYGEVYFQAWNSIYGHPKILASDDGRLIAAATPTKPATLYASIVNDPTHFNNVRQLDETVKNITYFGSILNTDPYIFTLASQRTSNIQFISSNRELIIGTDEKMYVATGGDGIIGPLNIQIRPFFSSPASKIFTNVEEGLVYLSLDKSKLVHFYYNTDNGTFVSREVSILSDDLYADKNIDQLVYNALENVIFMKRKYDGFLLTTKLNALVIVKDTGILAHASFDVPKPVRSMTYNAVTGEFFFTYTYDGRSVFTKWNIEGEVLSNERYLRMSQQIIPGSPQTTWTYDVGEDGDDVCYVDNNGEVGYATLNASKQFTTSSAVDSLHVGFCYRSAVCPMPIEAGQQWGSAQMGAKRVDTVSIRFFGVYTFKIKELNSRYTEEQNLAQTTTLGVTPYTGVYEVKLSSSPQREQVICVENDRPEPFVVLAMSFRGLSNDG